jgi:2-polyprenyl-3-methyl-5-hydroxy-6-metoxy-1,4-benzoquinol methylase
VTRKEIAARLASLYQHRGLQSYARWKVRFDPVYEAVAEQLRDRHEPLVDVGCGIGLLAFYLRESGFTAPIVGLDFDARKIDAARVAAKRYRDVDFIQSDARAPLPEQHNVTLLDVLQYFDDAGQQQILEHAARAVPPGGVVVIRQGIRDGSWRDRFTRMADAFTRLLRWMQMEQLNFPSHAKVSSAFAGFEKEARPLWGRTPYNNYLFVFRKAASPGMTNE